MGSPDAAANTASRPVDPQRRARGSVATPAAFVLAYVATLVQLPTIEGGSYRPWNPDTMDLAVYVDAARTLLNGGDLAGLRSGSHVLAFIYPPIAAVLSVPLSWLPRLAGQLLWTGISVACLVYVLRRFRLGGLGLVLVALAAVLVVEPIRTTLGYGQVNLVLMALVVRDLVPSTRPAASGRRRWVPLGVAVGLAAAIELTPLFFILMLLLVRRRRDAAWAIATFVVATVIGFVAAPRYGWSFVKGLVITHHTRASGAETLGNQAVTGFFARVVGQSHAVDVVALLVSAVVAVAGLIAAVRWYRRGQRLFAICVAGICSTLVAPLAWSHHFVWVVPLAVVLWRGRGALARLTSPDSHARSAPDSGQFATETYVAIGDAVRARSALSVPVLVTGGLYTVWMIAGRYMGLPAGNKQELTFTGLQDLFAGAGPVLGVLFVVVACWPDLMRPAAHVRSEPSGSVGADA